MNDFREMVRADLAARLKATVKRRRAKPKGMLQRAAIAAEVLPMFQDEARKRQATSTGGANPQLVVKRSQAGTTFRKSRDEAAAMMNVSPASVERDRLYRQTHGTFEDYCKKRWRRIRADALAPSTGSTRVWRVDDEEYRRPPG